MKENYIKKLIDGYLYQKNIDNNVVYLETLDNSIIIHVSNLFSSHTFLKVFDLIQYINNIINQVDEKTYHMQNVYLETDKGLGVDEIMLQWKIDDFNRINQKIAEVLKV